MLADVITRSGETRSAWARRLGISLPYLSSLASGNRRPSLDLALKIEIATGGAVPVQAWRLPEPKGDAA